MHVLPWQRYLCAQMLFAAAYAERENKKMLLEDRVVVAYEEMLSLQKKGRVIQDQQYDLQMKQAQFEVDKFGEQKKIYKEEFDYNKQQ